MNARKKKVEKTEPIIDLISLTFDENPVRMGEETPDPEVVDGVDPAVLPGNLSIGLEARIQGRDE